MPPDWAMAMASGASVTVSIAADISGMRSSISAVSRVRVSVSAGMTDERAGRNSTSSNVRASAIRASWEGTWDRAASGGCMALCSAAALARDYTVPQP